MREPCLLGRAMMRAGAETVSVRPAGWSERPLIERLAQFYIYDFSEMEPPGSKEMEFGDHGGYSPLPDLDLYWRLDGFRPLLIRVRQRLAGFALINTRSPQSQHRAQRGGIFRRAKTSPLRRGDRGGRPDPGAVSGSLGDCSGRTQRGGQGVLAARDRGRAECLSTGPAWRPRRVLARSYLELSGGLACHLGRGSA